MTPSRCLADFVAAAVKPTAIRPSAAGSQTRSSATHSRSPIQQLTSRRISGPHRPVVGSGSEDEDLSLEEGTTSSDGHQTIRLMNPLLFQVALSAASTAQEEEDEVEKEEGQSTDHSFWPMQLTNKVHICCGRHGSSPYTTKDCPFSTNPNPQFTSSQPSHPGQTCWFPDTLLLS